MFFVFLIDSFESMSKEQLRNLHLTDEGSQSQLPDIKNLEQLDTQIKEREEDGEEQTAAMETEDKITSTLPRKVRTSSGTKRSWSDDDVEEDSSSLASSQSSITRHFKKFGVSKDRLFHSKFRENSHFKVYHT